MRCIQETERRRSFGQSRERERADDMWDRMRLERLRKTTACEAGMSMEFSL